MPLSGSKLRKICPCPFISLPFPPIMLPYAIYIIYVNIKFEFNVNNMAMKRNMFICFFIFV